MAEARYRWGERRIMELEDRQEQTGMFATADLPYEQRWQALSLNVQDWLERCALAGGGEVGRSESGGMMWTYAPEEGGTGTLSVEAFDSERDVELLDGVIEWYRERSIGGVLAWCLSPVPPAVLETRLLARGFENNWQPHWMWLDMRELAPAIPPPAGIDIKIVVGLPLWDIDELPYYSSERAESTARLMAERPQRVWQFAAFVDGKVVGRCFLSTTMGDLGVAGIYEMGVVPSARNRGIGAAIVAAACSFARQLGCNHAVLNATDMGMPVYRRVGFRSMGYGYTWFLRGRTLAAPRPTSVQIAFAEAIGRGDIAALDAMSEQFAPEVLTARLAGGLTPLEIAVHRKQLGSADWLVAHDVHLDLLSAWDLGWKVQAAILLAENPALGNARSGAWKVTPLHTAVMRNDIELARLLLDAPIDLEIRDAEYDATALGWAQYNHRTEIIALIEQRLRQKNTEAE